MAGLKAIAWRPQPPTCSTFVGAVSWLGLHINTGQCVARSRTEFGDEDPEWCCHIYGPQMGYIVCFSGKWHRTGIGFNSYWTGPVFNFIGLHTCAIVISDVPSSFGALKHLCIQVWYIEYDHVPSVIGIKGTIFLSDNCGKYVKISIKAWNCSWFITDIWLMLHFIIHTIWSQMSQRQMTTVHLWL